MTGNCGLARYRAAYLAELASARLAGVTLAPPDPSDFTARLVAEHWGTRNERLDLDLAWLALWRHAALQPLCSANWRDRYFDDHGEEIDLTAELRALFRSPTLQSCFKRADSYRAHVTMLETGDPRGYLWRDLNTQRLLPPIIRFGLCAPEPAFYFAHGNVTRNCLAFHAPRCDNSDIVLTYLMDSSVAALEIYVGYRVAGQVWLVHGRDESGRTVLLADSVEFHPASPAFIAHLDEPVRRVCRRLAIESSASLLLNMRVFTHSAASLAARWLDNCGIAYKRRRPLPGRSLLDVDMAAITRLEFCKSAPWAHARKQLHPLGIERFRCYLDAWSGFVNEDHNQGEIWVVTW